MPDDAIVRPVAAERGLLRFLTCGSVDDGKSTLIGRLLSNAELVLTDRRRRERRLLQRSASGPPIGRRANRGQV